MHMKGSFHRVNVDATRKDISRRFFLDQITRRQAMEWLMTDDYRSLIAEMRSARLSLPSRPNAMAAPSMQISQSFLEHVYEQ